MTAPGMTAPGAFRKAVEAKDLAAVTASLSPAVTFRSPVMPKPYRGREQVTALLQVLLEVFEDFRYTHELVGTTGPLDALDALDAPAYRAPARALIFQARVLGKPLEGLDLVEFDETGMVGGLTVMVRPLPAAMTLAREVGRRAEELARRG